MKTLLIQSLVIIISIQFLISCGGKKAIKTDASQAANRHMAFSIRKINSNDPQIKTYFERLTKEALSKTYSSQVYHIPLQDNQLVESPEILYQIGINEIDDYFVIDLSLPANFSPHITSTNSELLDPEQIAAIPSRPINGIVSIYNGEKLRTVTNLRFQAESKLPSQTEEAYINRFHKAALEVFSNPNIYPNNNPIHYANLLYAYSQERETNTENSINCDNAKQILGTYIYTADLYKLGKKRGLDKVVGQQEESMELNQKIEDAMDKAKRIQTCEEDKQKSFQILYDFGTIDPGVQPYILEAFKSAGLEALLKQYTDKPVQFNFRLEDEGQLALIVDFRFDQKKYLGWIKGRIPEKYKVYQILALDPYYALMQKLVYFRYLIPAQAPITLRKSFQTMPVTVKMSTLFNGEVSYSVSGKYNYETKQVQMAFPNSVYLTVPGFDSRTILTKSNELFQEKGWIALGACKTLDGTYTEDGLLYKFFGFPCEG